METVFWGAVAVLAANGAVEVWRHGSLFERRRTLHRAGDRFVDRLLSCPFCLSVWAGWAAVAMVAAPAVLTHVPIVGPVLGPVGWLARLAAAGVACGRAANLLNDLTAGVSRTPDRRPADAGPAAVIGEFLSPPAGQDTPGV